MNAVLEPAELHSHNDKVNIMQNLCQIVNGFFQIASITRCCSLINQQSGRCFIIGIRLLNIYIAQLYQLQTVPIGKCSGYKPLFGKS